jgi:superfamily II DNA or RNA helicase/HKD family nuclease
MSAHEVRSGLYEALVTRELNALLVNLADALFAERGELANAEAADRIARHVARAVERAIDAFPESDRARLATRLAADLLERLHDLAPSVGVAAEIPLEPAQVLHAVLRHQPDGSVARIERPLTPLLDTTLLTNARGEPALLHELRAEIHSADAVDAVIAFIRWSGVQPLMEALRRHCADGKRLRILTTTYTNSTEQRALDELREAGAEVKVSYDTTATRLHAKAWVFHRESGYSTAYVGSSNLTHSAQVTGLEWNVRVAEARNADALRKIDAVFASYWASRDFVPYDPEVFRERNAGGQRGPIVILSPVEIQLRPFQEALLEDLALARHQGHRRNLLVAATGTGKTVMAAVDYARLRPSLERDRLLFVAHRQEIIDQSLATFRHALRDASFGERWVAGDRPSRFDYVFASIQSISSVGVQRIDPNHFDVVIVDEFHHAAAQSYEALLDRLQPAELLGLTATPERADGLDVLRYFDGRIAAEIRLWDAIDQQHLAPFSYFGVHDGVDLQQVPWRRGQGYDAEALTNVLTADHAWAHRVIEQVRRKVADPHAMRALGFCVGIAHARFMADRFNAAGLPSVALWGKSAPAERAHALQELAAGRLRAIFTVDLFNEGVDVPAVDTLLLLRPTDSATLFLQQLGRGLRKTAGKSVCTVLDYVATHRKEFRYDLRFRALLGGTRRQIERHVIDGFPFLPAGCHLELDRVAQEIVLRSIREAIPTTWRDRCAELRALGDVPLATFLEETGLEFEDVYASNRSWTDLRRAIGLPTAAAGPNEALLLRAVGRLLHVDDAERIAAYRRFVGAPLPPDPDALDERDRRLLRMLVASLAPARGSVTLQAAAADVWRHPQVLAELREVLDLLTERVGHVTRPLGLGSEVPLAVHARYTRTEILAAFGVGAATRPPAWQTGVWWEPQSRSDLFAFTLDKSSGGFSPTTRYRDYAISRELVHWESQSATAVTSPTGQRYIHHAEAGTHIVLFARLSTDDRAFWCVGTASYVSHEHDRPISFVWRLDHPLPVDLYTSFAAAVA